jgi:hypothetical protein
MSRRPSQAPRALCGRSPGLPGGNAPRYLRITMARAELAIAVLLLLPGLGCKRTAPNGVDAGASADPYTRVRSEDGSESRVRLGPGPIPPEFPPDVPLYPGAEFSSTVRTAKSVIVMLATSDPPDAVYAFYGKQPGYEQLSDLTVGDKRVLHLKQLASAKDFQVIVQAEGGRSRVSLVTHGAR